MGARRRLMMLAGTVSVAAWAQSHVNQPVPKYVTGDECLFCHRVKVADTWEQNPHARTIHPREDGDGPDAPVILGAHAPQRGLRPDGYGKFDLLARDGKTWDRETFAHRCAGCHATAVDPQTLAFSTSSLDCYTCHGVAPENHPNDTSLVWFSKKHSRDPRQIVSICGQCHLRTGKAKSSGLPYPNNFVAGDDLFADFQVDLTLGDNDRHILRNARDVLRGGSEVTCIDCHRIHERSSKRHRLVLSGEICLDCHNAEGSRKIVKPQGVHSELCEY